MTTPPRVAVILNPVSPRSGRALRAVTSACRQAGLGEPMVLGTTVEEPGESQTRYAVTQGCERIVAVGGDGTVRLVAGVLAGTSPDVDPARRLESGARPITLGVVPVGTANLFARSAGLPRGGMEAAARLAVTGQGRPTDVGTVDLTDEEGRTQSQPFLVVAGLGYDAETLAAVRARTKSRLRWLAYFTPGVRRLLRPGYDLKVTKDGTPLEVGRLWSLLAVNAARLPAGAQVVPGASLDDGILHVALVSPRGLLGWVRVAGTGLGGRPGRRSGRGTRPGSDGGPGYPRDHRSLAYRSAGDLVVETDRPVLAQVDGDVVPDVVKAQIRLLPRGLLVAR